MKYTYPTCRKSALIEDWFGTKLAAPYTWLRDTNAPEVKDFTARENAFTDAWFKDRGVDAMIKKLKDAYVPDPVFSISPWKDGYLASRNLEGNYSIVELDPNLNIKRTLFKRYDLPERTAFSAAACPLDDNILAIMAQVDAAPRPDNVIYDFEAGEILTIMPMTFSGEWSKKKKSFYSPATRIEGEQSITVIQRWDAETNSLTDVLAYPENSIFGQVNRSDDGNYFIFSFSSNYSEQVFYSYDEESGRITPLNEGRPLELIYVDSMDDIHYFISLKESDHGWLLAVPEGKTIADASVVYREGTGYMDSGFAVGGKLFVHVQSCAASTVKRMPEGTCVPLPEEVCALEPAGYGKGFRLFKCESFTKMPQILKFDGEGFMVFSKAACGAAVEAGGICNGDAPSDQDTEGIGCSGAAPAPGSAAELCVELLFAKSAVDGVEIPYYLVHRKDAKTDRSNPTLMYGYGGYNISSPPWSVEMVTGTNIPEWVNSGGIYVHCLLRGGNEYGPAWHEAGMGMTKKNCYADFIGIAEKIIADGWTSPKHIAISGCSNGGLLMSALVTMRPDLWGCVIDSVPHTDMIHFAQDDRGPMYITEYGDPKRSREEFEYLLSYSPVHNVRETEYPPVYIQTGECDNNVPPYHGKSFAATMQEKNTSNNPVLLRVLEKGSHDRGQGEVYWRTVAEMRVFMETYVR